MNRNILIAGWNNAANEFLQKLALLNRELNVTVYAPQRKTDLPEEQAAAAQNMANTTHIEAKDQPDWSEQDLLVIFADPSEENDEEKYEEALIRQAANNAMANGFNGQVCIVAKYDVQDVYAFLRYSGLASTKVYGLGTSLQTFVVRRMVAKQLRASVADVKINCIGTAAENLLAWSRAQFGTSSLLALAAKTNFIFGPDQIKQIEENYNAYVAAIYETLVCRILLSIIIAVIGKGHIIQTLSVQQGSKSNQMVVSRPVLLGRNGIVDLFGVSLSEDEQERYRQIQNDSLNSIASLNKK